MLALTIALLAQVAPTANPDFPATFAKTTAMIKQGFYDKNRLPEVERAFAKHKAAILASKSKAEFGLKMNAMIEEMGDSHFAFLGDTEQGYYSFGSLIGAMTGGKELDMPTMDAWFSSAPMDGGYRIKMIMEGGSAQAAGLRKGDVVVSIDGKPFSPIEALRRLVGKQPSVTYRRDGKETTVKVGVSENGALNMFVQGTLKSRKIIEVGGKKFGYIHTWMMLGDKQINALHGAMDSQFKNTDGMIWDLRDGFGGRPEKFADPFFRPEATMVWEGQGIKMSQNFGYARPLVVIINEGSRSAKEVMAYILKKSGRATLVGRTTAGNVLGTSPQRINDWAYLEIPMVDLKVDGIRLEKNGVKPDVEVPVEFDAAGKDLMLEKAVEVVAGKVKAAAVKNP